MLEKIIFSVISFVIFAYVFIFKLIKKNDTTYLVILIGQAIGILLNFIQIIFSAFEIVGIKIICYTFCIIIPVVILVLETRGFNFSELLYVCISKILISLGNRKKAKEMLIKLVVKYDKSYKGHKMLAEIYEEEGGMRKAIDEYVKVLDIKGNDYKSYFRISELLNNLDKKDEAIEMLSILLNKKPELYEPCKMLGDLLLDKGKYKEAINVYIRGIKYNPDKADLYYNIGIAYARTNEFALSKECFLKTVEIDSNFYNAYYRLGQLSLLYRDIDLAEKYFLQAIYEETEGKAYYQLSKVYMMKNNKTKASIFINRAIEIDAKYYEIIKNEPIFLPIKDLIEKPDSSNNQPSVIESKKEKDISDYLDDTYNLTKILNQKNSNKNKKKFN